MWIPNWIRRLFDKNKPISLSEGVLEKEFGVQSAASRLMADNIGLWYALYTNHPPWESECVRPLGLPEAIGREIARHSLTEFSASFSDGAQFLQEQFQVEDDIYEYGDFTSDTTFT